MQKKDQSERNKKKNEVEKKKKRKKSYSVRYPESSVNSTGLEVVEEAVLLLEVELLDVSFSIWA